MPSWLGSTIVQNVIATIATIIAIISIFVACGANDNSTQANDNSAEANSIASRSLAIAEESADAIREVTPDGAILAPTALSDSLCYRFSGFSARLPGNPTLWISVRGQDAPNLYLTEVRRLEEPFEEDVAAALNADESSQPWVAAVQIGDHTIGQQALRYDIALYYANTEQSVKLRTSIGPAGTPTIPAGVEEQRLGDVLSLQAEQHPSLAGFTCTLDNATSE